MRAFITYLAPEGDELCVVVGYTFADGEPLQVSNDILIEKARGNRFFDVEDVAEVSEAVEVLEKRKPGRPARLSPPRLSNLSRNRRRTKPHL